MASVLTPMLAQSITGSLSGSVTDSSGGAAANAGAKLRSAATGFERTATTNEAGRFVFASLRPGPYTLQIEARVLSGWRPGR